MVVNDVKRILSFLLMNHLNSFRHLLIRSSSKKIQDCPSHFVLINDATDLRNQVSSYGRRKSTRSWTSTPSDGFAIAGASIFLYLYRSLGDNAY